VYGIDRFHAHEPLYKTRMGELQRVDNSGPLRCSFCSNDAAGPCATCARPVCGDCCTLKAGGVRTWAVCLDCDRHGGRSLMHVWKPVLAWVFVVLLVLFLVVVLLAWIST